MDLATYEPVPSGDQCLPAERLKAIFHGDSKWTPREDAHLHECLWCQHDALWGTEECIQHPRLIAFSMGGEPTEEEAKHLASCPQCAWEYVWITTKSAEGGTGRPDTHSAE